MQRSSRDPLIEDLTDIANDLDESTTGNAVTTFLDVLSFIVEYDIPTVELTRLGLTGDSNSDGRLAYTVGEGVSCIVLQHALEKDVNSRISAGTVVALKKYIPLDSPAGGNGRRPSSETYAVIHQELSAFCHNTLRNHENICKLLFLGWEEQSPLPVLGTELPSYGSLDYALRSPGTGPSFVQKCNMTLDIALGLAALHECGIVHGNIKCENVIIQEHGERQIVAKLTGFGGTADVTSPRACPTHRTDLWLSPECLFGEPDIDWRKADVYAYGLVVASIWLRSNRYQHGELEASCSTCCLSYFTPNVFTGEAESQWLLIMKSEVDENESSVLKRVLSPLDQTEKPLLLPLLQATLSTLPWKRKTAEEILQSSLRPLAMRVDRNVLSQSRTTPHHPPRMGDRLFKVWSPAFQNRTREFQSYVLKQMQEEVDGAEKVLAPLPRDLPDDLFGETSVDTFLDTLSFTARRIIRNKWTDSEKSRRVGRYAYHIALCFLLGIGTRVREDFGVMWLGISALWGNALALSATPLVYPFCLGDVELLGPIKMYLALCALSGSRKALYELKINYPAIYQAAVRTLSERPLPEDGDFVDSVPFLLNVASTYRQCSATPPERMDLRMAIKSRNVNKARALLDAGADASDVGPNGVGILHCLHTLEGPTAAELAPICFINGARLDLTATERPSFQTHQGQASGTPIRWAAHKGCQELFESLLFLHVSHDQPIEDYDLVVGETVLWYQPTLLRQLLQLKRDKPTLCPIYHAPGAPLNAFSLDQALFLALRRKEILDVERRHKNGEDPLATQRATISLLLEFGANPTLCRGSSAIFETLGSDDALALELFLDYLVAHHPDPIRYLTRCDFATGVHQHTALQLSIYKRAEECFKVLLKRFPELMECRNARGLTALHSSVYHRDTILLAVQLLEKGANIFVWSEDRSTPLSRALQSGNIDATELLADRCSRQELDMLVGRDAASGSPLLARLLSTWPSDRSPKRLEAIKWIIRKGGARLLKDDWLELSIWRILLARLPPPLAAQCAMDAALQELLFDTFKDELECTDLSGRAAIHYTAWGGHLDALRLLLARNVNLNKETERCRVQISGYPNDYMARCTALDLAITRSRSRNIPEDVQRGGKVEIERWQDTMKAITELLITSGAQSGSGAPSVVRMAALSLIHRANGSVRLSNVSDWEPLEDDVIFRGTWPKQLPRDHSSPSEAQVEEERGNVDEELASERVIRVSGRELHDLFGSLAFDRQSEPLLEAYKKRLRHEENRRRLLRPIWEDVLR